METIARQLTGLGTLRVWFDKRNETLSPGIVAADFNEALYVLLLLNLANVESVAICTRCGHQFRRTRTAQAFCSLRCGNNARQAKQRMKRKGEKNVTRKAR
ncbi:MAG: hypothetical protein H0X25_10220 [Acidobacteriales bacterium]|nr:hypothetical protein [Terriglobales bacterium]